MKRNFLVAFIFTGFLAGLLLTWQFNTKIAIEGHFPSDEIAAKEDLLKSFLDEQSYLQSKIVSLRREIEKSQGNIDVQKPNVNFLENLKVDIGLTEITGEGLEILLDDGKLGDRAMTEISDLNLIQASDLRDIVNILNAAKADAISINNQRVIAHSPISSIGTTILVNNSHIAPPFVISAVGDTDIMVQRLRSLIPSLYEKRSKNSISLEVYKKNRLTIPIYNGDFKIEYLTLVETNN